MTKEEALRAIAATKEIQKRVAEKYGTDYIPKWSIFCMPNTFELKACSYSSVVCAYGFPTKIDAEEFLAENIELFKEKYGLK